MFGDNESFVKKSMKFHANLHKRHKLLSFHRVRESIAAYICQFHNVCNEDTPDDILSKHWSFNCSWKLMSPILFWSGDTTLIQNNDTTNNKDE